MNGKNTPTGFVVMPRVKKRRGRKRDARVTRPRPECILDTPGIIWPDRRGDSPTGRLIEIIFGDEGWARGTINQDLIPKGISSSHEFYRWSWRLCRDRMCTRCFDESLVIIDEETDFMMMATANPLAARMKSYIGAWCYQKEPLRRAIFLLALIGENGARPNGYYRNDIARIAGISPHSKSVDTLIKHLTRWGFISRQKRKGKTPRYWYKSEPSHAAVRSARNESARDLLRYQYGAPIMFHTKKYGSLREGENYTRLGMGSLVGPAPPRIVKETLDAVTVLASIVYRKFLEDADCSIGGRKHVRLHLQDLDEVDITHHACYLVERLIAMYQEADRAELLQLKRWEETLRGPSRDSYEMTYALFELSNLFDSDSSSCYWTWEPDEDSSEVD